jgi:hypothetical protein
MIRNLCSKFFLVLIFANIIYSQNLCPGIPTVTYAGKTYHKVQISYLVI